jgi:ABC-type multidrug transport system fused ATPase/permease subunit
MIGTFLKLFQLLTRKQRREFYILQCFMLASALSELVGTVSIMPFIALAANPEIAQTNPYFAQFHQYMGAPSHEQFLVSVGAMFVGLIVVSNLIMVISQFLMNRYSFRVGGELSTRLYQYYLSKDILYHARTNTAAMIQKVMRDSFMLSSFLIAPALRLNARIFSVALLAGMIVYVDPLVALSTVLVLGGVYFFIYRFVRRVIHENGLLVSQLGQQRNQVLNESFGGIRDVKLYSYEAGYLSQYQRDTKRSDRAAADNLILGEVPYFIVETVVFAGMVLLTLYLYSAESGMSAVLPMLTLYCLAGIKIVPKVQQSYLAVTRIRSAQPVFKRLCADLLASREASQFQDESHKIITPEHSIEIRNLSFSHGEGHQPLFKDFSESFEAGKVTAVTGGSGVGKSTLLEIVMGLVQPQAGCIAVDGEPLSEADLPSWRASIGYVPQEVYLVDSSIAENIAFGEEREDIDMERVARVARCASLQQTVEVLPDGYWTQIGERGGLLSGGQRQRIGIARALYRNVSLLFLDEATSALDAATQSDILEKLAQLRPKITVVMITHRTETLSVADKVIQLA